MSLNKKIDKCYLEANLIRPHLICISEHHMKKQKMSKFSLPGYKLATFFLSGKILKEGERIW